MRRALERDQDLLGEEEPPNDLILGAPALLGIFFALALVCAVCFGFGYSSGHGLHLPGPQTVAIPAAPRTSAPAPEADSPREGAAMATPSAAQEPAAPAAGQKPAPGVGLAAGQPSSTAETQAPISGRHGSTADEQAWPPGEAQAPTAQQAPVLPAKNAAAVQQGAALEEGAPSVSLMVQIAAVSHAADAQTLATALRHDGFASVVRTTTGDPFFHVQVGPFASLQAAKAMRTRLSDSGYNAFIKP